MQRWRAQKTSFPDLFAELKRLTPDLVQALPNLPSNLLLAPGRVEMMTASQRRQSRKLTELQFALARQSQRQRQQFGLLLVSLAVIALMTTRSLGGDGAPGLTAASVLIGAFGLLQLIKGKG